MGNAEEIARIIPADRIYVGLCFICAMRAEPGHVNHLEGGNIQFAPFVPSPEGSERPGNSPNCLPTPASDARL